MISRMFDNGSLPALQRMAQFTAERHKFIVHNIANLSTPGYRPVDLSPESFQKSLGEAIDKRRKASGGTPTGRLKLADTPQVRFTASGIQSRPGELNENILFQDGNNRDLERTMQKLAENAMAHQGAVEMLRNRLDLLETAIRERI